MTHIQQGKRVRPWHLLHSQLLSSQLASRLRQSWTVPRSRFFLKAGTRDQNETNDYPISLHGKHWSAIVLRPLQLHNDRDQLQGVRSRLAEPLPHQQTRPDPSHHSVPPEGGVDILQLEMRV